ncbi:MAG: class I tRNA ligase family protein, partial [Bacteroidales bacterium]
MEYNFIEIEAKWQKHWHQNNLYKVTEDTTKPKFYILDMFPYPSGAGLHVGHPLGYIASDIYSRYMRLKGYNVLHPMGYDAFGLPAEQYAIQTGKHPAKTTAENITRYREQLDRIGFCFDWSREVRTCDPQYYKWTQWMFVQLFHHWYNNKTQKAEHIDNLIKIFETEGNETIDAANNCKEKFTASQWNSLTYNQKQEILLSYRLAYLADTMVNWCPALGTVLANDEVKDGFSERGGHPVEQKLMKQWCLRISAYAQRLLDGLEKIQWSESIKEIQRNWIGRSEGAEIDFQIKDSDQALRVFTTRADTIFGVTFMVVAPESDYVPLITKPEHIQNVNTYIEETKKRTERERMADTKTVTGVFSGSYCINPLTGEEIPIWISDYVLAGYGTGAIMAVPAHDTRDFKFARQFNLPIIQVVVPVGETPSDTATWSDAKDSKEGTMINSGFITGLSVPEAIEKTKLYVKDKNLGTVKVNYRLRDAIFSRQRYWGEPFPVYYKDGIPHVFEEKDLPLLLPDIDSYLPTETGQPPLARAQNWTTNQGYPIEYSTMPGFAGSSAYYLRYMDPHNPDNLVSKEANNYWKNVDIYFGGNEHATGHLIYSRFFNKFLYDLGYICEDEPFKKLINQGMIQGRSNFVYRINGTNIFVPKEYYDALSKDKITPEQKKEVIEKLRKTIIEQTGKDLLRDFFNTDSTTIITDITISQLHVDINLVKDDILDKDAFRAWQSNYSNALFIPIHGDYVCGTAIEKMSKSKFNVVNPDEMCNKYGADTFRLYEMFLGPLEISKPWDTKGIEGVHRFLKKLWNLFFFNGQFVITNEIPTKQELKILHKTIKKIAEDIENISFNTSVSAFMICVN